MWSDLGDVGHDRLTASARSGKRPDNALRENALLYVCIVLYILVLVVVSAVAFRRKRQAVAEARPSRGESAGHFGGSFGPVVLILTTFATIYSGFVITGVPEEARTRGFVSLRWISASMAVVCGMLLYYPRLRRLSALWGYMSPNDFITDRYRSRWLRVMCACCSCCPLVVSLTVQMVAFSAIVDGVTPGNIPPAVSMAVFGAIILVLEFLGGMNSVVMTDVVQSVIMLVAFPITPVIIASHYGIFGSIAGDDCSHLLYRLNSSSSPEVAPGVCPQEAMLIKNTSAPCHAFGCVCAGCLQKVMPKFYKYPDIDDRLGMGFFIVNMIAWPLEPQMIQRAYIAANDGVLRWVCGAMLAAPFFAQAPAILIGLTKANYEAVWPETSQKATAFAAITEELMRFGPGEYLLSTVMTCAAMAAIISLACSVLIGFSATFTFDVYKGFICLDASPVAVQRMAQGISVVLVCTALAFGCGLSVASFGSLLEVQTGLGMQLVPAFGLGLYFDISARPVALGIGVGLSVFLVLGILEYINVVHPFNSWGLPVSVTAALFNFAAVFALQLLAPGNDDMFRPSAVEAGDRFGSRVTPSGIRRAMAGGREPPRVLVALMLLALLLSLPWYCAAGSEAGPNALGLPTWGFIMILVQVAVAVLGFVVVAIWRPPVEEERLNPGYRLSFGATWGGAPCTIGGSGWSRRYSEEPFLRHSRPSAPLFS